MQKITFKAPRQDAFAVELQAQVKEYFSKNKISPHWNALMATKSLFYLGGYLMCAALILSHPSSGYVTLMICALLGFFIAGIGFNVGHDAIHGAYSKNRRLNKIMSQSYTLIGAHEYNWRILHNVIHHSYTNIVGADGDLHPGPWFRFYKCDKDLKPFHRFQHLYALPLYTLTTLVWAVKKDFDHIFKKSHYAYTKPALPKGEFAFLVAFKTLYFLIFLGLPMWIGGYSFAQVLLGFLTMHAASGLMLALTFQLGHIVEGPQVLRLDEQDSGFESWHRHQLLGTANFAPDNRFVNWICGGLNYQIEHHLFPQVCHVHYPKLSPIVKNLANKHGLPYHQYSTAFSALRSHFRLLKDAGRGLEGQEFQKSLQTAPLMAGEALVEAPTLAPLSEVEVFAELK